MALYKATDPKGGVDFHLINPKTKSRIVQVVKDPTTGQELDRRNLARGFEVAKNQYVPIDPEELKALRIESTHVIDLERFVDAATIDRIYGDEPYDLALSEKTGSEAFAVILEAMREKALVGIGRVVLNNRERICAREPRDHRMLLTTLRTHEDIVTAKDVGGITKVTDRKQAIAIALSEAGLSKGDSKRTAEKKAAAVDAATAPSDGFEMLAVGVGVDGTSGCSIVNSPTQPMRVACLKEDDRGGHSARLGDSRSVGGWRFRCNQSIQARRSSVGR